MKTIHRADTRGVTRLGWLDSRHSFSFGGFRDPHRTGFGPLRVLNDDRVAPGGGFDTHPHADMEIVSYVVEGALTHRDSAGHAATVYAGGVQRMTAGSGIEHAEFNPSGDEPVRFVQIWIRPSERGLVPSYEDATVAALRGTLVPIATPDGRDGSTTIHQDAIVSVARLGEGDTIVHAIEPGRLAWVQVVSGELTMDRDLLQEGDGVAIENEAALTLTAGGTAEVLVFDLPSAR